MSRHITLFSLSAVAVVLVPLCLLLASQRGSIHGAAAAPATPGSSPRLFLRAHTAHAAGSFAGHRASLSVYPAIPGSNSVRLSVNSIPREVQSIHLSLSMPGMHMAPATGSITRHGAGFAGNMRIPMFGVYHVVATGQAGHTRLSGVLHLALPILFK